MATYFQALLWAAAIIFVALASQANLIPEDIRDLPGPHLASRRLGLDQPRP